MMKMCPALIKGIAQSQFPWRIHGLKRRILFRGVLLKRLQIFLRSPMVNCERDEVVICVARIILT